MKRKISCCSSYNRMKIENHENHIQPRQIIQESYKSYKSYKMGDSRTKKALSTTALIMLVAYEDFKIRFKQTKQSFYAEKVFIGTEISKGLDQYDSSDFLNISYQFMNIMEKTINEGKGDGYYDIPITKEMIGTLTKIEMINETNNSKIKNKNREAAFSNFLAYLLLQNGYELVCATKKMKKATKTIQFYTWSEIHNTTKNIHFIINDHKMELMNAVDELKQFIDTSKTLQFDRHQLFSETSFGSFLCPCASNSAFRPTTVHFKVL